MPEARPAKEEILERIRSSNPRENDDMRLIQEWMGIRRSFRKKGSLEPEDRLAMLEDRIGDYGGGVHHATSESELARVIGAAVAARAKRKMVVPPQFPQSWLPNEIEITRDEGLSYAELDQCDGVITACTLAIAWTGTIVLQGGPFEGRRALTLVPDYHLCLVRVDQIVEFVPEALEKLRAFATRPITFFSGPSATSDIEMTRIKGVHGPRVLDAVILG
jgi:L-lactate dehydrogenase complex protein LldG